MLLDIFLLKSESKDKIFKIIVHVQFHPISYRKCLLFTVLFKLVLIRYLLGEGYLTLIYDRLRGTNRHNMRVSHHLF